MIGASRNNSLDPRDIEAFKNSPLFDWKTEKNIEPPRHVFIGCDPNAMGGNEQSYTATVMVDGRVVVRYSKENILYKNTIKNISTYYKNIIMCIRWLLLLFSFWHFFVRNRPSLYCVRPSCKTLHTWDMCELF